MGSRDYCVNLEINLTRDWLFAFWLENDRRSVNHFGCARELSDYRTKQFLNLKLPMVCDREGENYVNSRTVKVSLSN